MVANGADEVRSALGKARASVARGRSGPGSLEGAAAVLDPADGVLRAVT
jgi:hypothetical protein